MFKLIRDVWRAECPWLHRDFSKGEEVYEYFGPTYGCISATGIAVTIEDQVTPFFELPQDALG